MVASEPVTVLDTSTAPWTVLADGVPQQLSAVVQAGSNVLIQTDPLMAQAVTLSYAGGSFVQGDVSGLFLQAVVDFPVTIM